MIGFAISYLAITLFFAAISFIAGLLLSQRTAGPNLMPFKKAHLLKRSFDGPYA
jgi:hypothetical protein